MALQHSRDLEQHCSDNVYKKYSLGQTAYFSLFSLGLLSWVFMDIVELDQVKMIIMFYNMTTNGDCKA